MCKCNQKNCNLEVFENSDKCVLHCEKDKDTFGFSDSSYKYFWETFNKKIIHEKLFKIKISKGTGICKDIIEIDNISFPTIKNSIIKSIIFFDIQTKEYELIFKMCKFYGKIDFKELILNEKKLLFNHCDFFDNINLEDLTIKNLIEIKECTFLEGINLKNARFKKFVDFEGTKFNDIYFKNTVFENKVIFRNTQFRKKIDFKYVTFKDVAIFKDTIFWIGINFRDTIFEKNASFLDISSDENSKKDVIVANRETARIIKDSFEQQNNIIEANKFYALEMKEREKELEIDIKEGKNILEWLVFKFHGLSSNHSQDWLLALYWIFIIGFISSYYDFNLIQYEGKNVHYELSSVVKTIGLIFVGLFLNSICKIKDKLVNGSYFIICFYLVYIYSTEDYLLSLFSKTINPFSVMKTNDAINGIQLFFKIIIAYLIYQLIISIRQNTRRK